jgi:capsular exopolysaccharide synthesis family protein
MHAQTRFAAFRQAVAVLRRRLPLIVACVVAVPAVAFAVSKAQTPVHEGSATVLVTFKDPSADVRGNVDGVFNRDDAQRFAVTQASLARTPELAGRVVRRLPGRRTAQEFLDSSSALPRPGTDLIDFTVRDEKASRARRAAAIYAKQFIAYRGRLERGSLRAALRDVDRRRAGLRSRGRTRSQRYQRLTARSRTLRSLAALPAANAFFVSSADATHQLEPRTVRNVAFGLALGLVLAFGLVLLREAFDTRPRNGLEIADALAIPLLGRLPTPARRRGNDGKPEVLKAPDGHDAEAFRTLRASLAVATAQAPAQTLLVVSGVQGEGKTTTVANLAATMARAGQRVVVVDLDLRNPGLARTFGLNGPGLADVALGTAELEEALAQVRLRYGGGKNRQDLEELGNGRLEVLTAGTPVSDPGELVGTERLGEILTALRLRADVVVIDCPPWLQVGDGLLLSARADALLVVARIGTVRREALAELRKLLEASRARALGVVLTGAEHEDRVGYSHGYYLLADEPWAGQDASRGAVGSPQP